MGEVKNAVSNDIQNSLLPHLQISNCYKINLGWSLGMRLRHIQYHCWEKSGLAHFIQVCNLQLLSWYLHFLAIQAGSSIVFSLMKNFHECCWWNTWDIATRLAVFAPHLLPLSPSCSSSSFPPHVGSLRVSLLLSRQLHCHSPAAHRTPWTSVWFGNETSTCCQQNYLSSIVFCTVLHSRSTVIEILDMNVTNGENEQP